MPDITNKFKVLRDAASKFARGDVPAGDKFDVNVTDEVKQQGPKAGKEGSLNPLPKSQAVPTLEKATNITAKPGAITYSQTAPGQGNAAPKSSTPKWKENWDAKPAADKAAFKSKLSDQRAQKAPSKGTTSMVTAPKPGTAILKSMEKSNFSKLETKLEHEGKTKAQAGGIAYKVGVEKYGKKGMAAKAKAGMKKSADSELREARLKETTKQIKVPGLEKSSEWEVPGEVPEMHKAMPEDGQQDPSQMDQHPDMATSDVEEMLHHLQEFMAAYQDGDLPDWVMAKLTLANDYISTAAHYLMGGAPEEEQTLGAEQPLQESENAPMSHEQKMWKMAKCWLGKSNMKKSEKGVHKEEKEASSHFGTTVSGAGSDVRSAKTESGKSIAKPLMNRAKNEHKATLSDLKSMRNNKEGMGKSSEHQAHPGPSKSAHQKAYDAKTQSAHETHLKTPKGDAERKARNAKTVANMGKSDDMGVEDMEMSKSSEKSGVTTGPNATTGHEKGVHKPAYQGQKGKELGHSETGNGVRGTRNSNSSNFNPKAAASKAKEGHAKVLGELKSQKKPKLPD